jgi:DNA-binding GntR family transcriptional regulator
MASEHDGIIDALRRQDMRALIERLDQHRGKALNEVTTMLGGI